ncbi:MOSC N-terminal beta barrel domain-containing protein, partial [Actinoplanes philippinensis]|uniref:MOSC N-terminal beta barrel domain-containing protein n=1 Tax=Actinoplanes philippinensis TaxID=35752 RepID=UPI001945A647
MQLVEIRRYPVKSLLGEVVEVAAVDARGLVGDRLWAIRDADGKFGSGKNTRRFRRMPGLFDLRAYFDAVNALDPSVVPGGASILRSAGPHLSGGAGADHMTGSSATNDAVTVQVAGSDSAGDGAGGPGVESGSASGEVGVRVVGSASAGGIGAVAGSSEVPVPGIGSGPAGGGAGVPAV